MTLEHLRLLSEAAGFTRLRTDELTVADPSGFQPEGWRIHDFPDTPNPQGVWIANYICGGMDEVEAKMIAAAVNLVRAMLQPETLERMARAIAEDGIRQVVEANNEPIEETWAEFPEEHKQTCRSLAQAALSALIETEERK